MGRSTTYQEARKMSSGEKWTVSILISIVITCYVISVGIFNFKMQTDKIAFQPSKKNLAVKPIPKAL